MSISGSNEEIWLAVLHVITDGVAIFDSDGRITTLNSVAESILGGKADQLRGLKLAELPCRLIRENGLPFPLEDHPVLIALKTGAKCAAEVMGITKPQGSITWAVVRAESLVRPGVNAPYAVAGIFTDVTERRHLRDEIESERGQLLTLVRTIPDLVWLKDQSGVYLACNAQFERFFGATEKDILGKTDYDFVDKSLADFFRQKDQEAIAANQPTINEEAITYPDGRHAVLETIKTPMRDDSGKLIGVLGIGREITTRKSTEDSLREYQRELQLALHVGHIGTFDMNLQTGEAEWTRELADIWGVQTALNQNFADYCWGHVHPDDLPSTKEAFARILETREVGEMEFRILRDDGQERWIRWRGQVVADADQTAARVVGVNLDC